jgi:hypothetical protein
MYFILCAGDTDLTGLYGFFMPFYFYSYLTINNIFHYSLFTIRYSLFIIIKENVKNTQSILLSELRLRIGQVAGALPVVRRVEHVCGGAAYQGER